jgi:DNA polymerase-3 subunit beta
MDFTINRAVMAEALKLILSVAETKNTIPILTNCLIMASENKARIAATDLDVAISLEREAVVAVEGTAAVPAKKLGEIVSAMSGDQVRFSTEADTAKVENFWVELRCADSWFKLGGVAKSRYPDMPKLPSAAAGSAVEALGGTKRPAKVQIAGKLVKQLIARTMLAITMEESRYALSGALFLIGDYKGTYEPEPGKGLHKPRYGLKMVSTDGHRLALMELPLDKERKLDEGPAEISVIVPRKAMKVLLAAIPDEEVTFTKADNHLFFTAASAEVATRMLSGQFPNYEMVIPKNGGLRLEMSRAALMAPLRRIALTADDRSHAVKFELDKGNLLLSSSTDDVGEGKDLVPVQGEGANGKTVFKLNASLLVDFLNVLEADKQIVMTVKDEQTPVLFTTIDDYRFVIMPMRL